MCRKIGEDEAISILKSLGYSVDDDYRDDGCQKNMPDIRLFSGEYCEVTHTKHNNHYPMNGNNYAFLSIEEKIKKEQQFSEAWQRINQRDYEQSEIGELTPKGQQECQKDIDIIKKHSGYDLTKFSDNHTEFGCDCPSFQYSLQNIEKEIIDDKGKLYKDKGYTINLFIFVTETEMSLLNESISDSIYSSQFKSLCKTIALSPFKKVFICSWDFIRQKYNVDNPEIYIFDSNNPYEYSYHKGRR